MKKIKENRVLYIIVNGMATGLAGVIIWPLLDLILCKFITRSPFIYSVHEHIIQPIIFGFIVSLIIDITFRRKD